MTVQNIKRKIVPILKRQGVIKAALFGSYVTGEAKKNSDIDLLVSLQRNKTLLDLVGLKLELEKKLGKRVDILTYNGIHPLLKDIILKEQKIIYEKRKKS
ncbi:MAG: nucleotidyltransferase family protein [Candidatus Pacebacteria bacterium]|nr:nucleotidyltransferase family protein [Candidatus Paceibacterota bacterium]